MADPVSLGFTLVLTAGQMGLQASRKIEGPRLDDRTVSLGDPGDSKNYFLGTRRFESCSFLFAEDLHEVKKRRKTKGGKYTEYKYYGTWANHIADHPIDGVTRIWLDKHLVFDVTGAGPIMPFVSSRTAFAVGGQATVNNPYFTFYLGGEDQEPDPRMLQTVEALHGEGSCPAYRGQAMVVLKDIPLEKFGNRLPQPTIEATCNPVPAYPWETFEVSVPGNRLWGFTYSPDRSIMMWAQDSSFELWDVAARARMIAGTLAVDVGVQDVFGVTNNGAVYALSGGSIVAFNPDFAGVATVGAAPFQDGLRVLQDGNGGEHVVTMGSAFISYFFTCSISGVGGVVTISTPSIGDGSSWTTRGACTDSYGDIWVVGSRAGFFGSWDDLFLYRVVDSGARPGSLGFAHLNVGAFANGAPAEIAHYDGHFIVHWNNALLVKIEDETLTIVDSVARGGDPYNTPKQWANLFPGSPTIWLNGAEVSLSTLQVVRTVTFADWKAEDADGVIYDPLNHALICFPQFSLVITWRYLDRINGDGVTIAACIDMVSGMADAGSDDYNAALCTDTIDGFSFTAGVAKSILSPLLEAHDIDPVSEDFIVRFRPRSGTVEGDVPSGKIVPTGESRFAVNQAKDEDLPLQVTMTFADVDKDQQDNLAVSARAADAVRTKRITPIDMRNMATDADNARHLVDRFMRRQHAEKESYDLSLSDRFRRITPGSVYTLNLDDLTRIGRCVSTRIGADRVTETRWVRDNPSLAGRSAGRGAALDSRTAERIQVPSISKGFILDVPLPTDAADDPTPFMLVAAAPYSSGVFWTGATVYVSDTGDEDEYEPDWAYISYQSAATWGYCNGSLGDALPWVPDNGNSVNVAVQNGLLTSVTMDQLLNDATLNLALIGSEYVQFATATLEGDGTYTLSGFLRGRRGTEQQIGTQLAGAPFLLIDTALVKKTMGASEIGDTDYYKTVSQGREEETARAEWRTFTAAAQKPYSPVHGELLLDTGTGDWSIDAVRRTRIGGANIDGQDVPLGETSESWSCDILDGAAVVRTITGSSLPLGYSSAQQTADFGAPQTSLSVNLYQVSPVLSLRGFPLSITA
ncbi:phage tail protein [Sphingobium sp. JS3065]|uniref:phage tail protein n=1 Tax=Sphingobium sp. JS3065 TaxID=2970925 RepID=UPI002264FF91|nr:phage tail protein [Sphingobium sp. JS3065]UZW55563.1 phage tail protein [Sphingobium sp. JS3065]